MKKRKKIIILAVSLFFIFGTPYPKTTYYLRSNSSEKSYGSSVSPEHDPEYGDSIEKSPTAFLRPFSLSFDTDTRPRSPSYSLFPGFKYNARLGFLLDERHEQFHLYSIDFEYSDKNIHYEIDREYVIDYDGKSTTLFFADGLEWVYGSTGGLKWVDGSLDSFLPVIDIRPFSRGTKKNENTAVRITITYRFAGEEVKYQHIDYLASKWKRMDWFSPLGFILMFIIPWG
jgi:hypothetical protein